MLNITVLFFMVTLVSIGIATEPIETQKPTPKHQKIYPTNCCGCKKSTIIQIDDAATVIETAVRSISPALLLVDPTAGITVGAVNAFVHAGVETIHRIRKNTPDPEEK